MVPGMRDGTYVVPQLDPLILLADTNFIKKIALTISYHLTYDGKYL